MSELQDLRSRYAKLRKELMDLDRDLKKYNKMFDFLPERNIGVYPKIKNSKDIDRILKQIELVSKVSLIELNSTKSRATRYKEARCIIALILNDLGVKKDRIAFLIKRNRATIDNTIKTANELFQYDSFFKDKIQTIREII
jgi:carbamoylphosphate synthase small subunit